MMVGGFFYVLIDGRRVCDYQHWAFASCAIGSLSNFKSHLYHNVDRDAKWPAPSNYELLEKHHTALFEWLGKNAPEGSYHPKEFYMALGDAQVRLLPKMLMHECVREVDHFLNKSHGSSNLHLFRISINKDFPR